MNDDQLRVYNAVVSGRRGEVKGPLLAALHRPELADKWQQFGEMLRYRTTLPAHLTELAILVTARWCNCEMEWFFHEPPAVAAGLPSEIIEAVRNSQRPMTDDAATLEVFDYCRELQESHTVTDAPYASIKNRWGIVGVVELTALVGYYTLVAMTLNAHQYELPIDADPPFERANASMEVANERA